MEAQFDGKGVTVAVVDTGIFAHPDFTVPENRIAAFVDLVNNRKDPYDDNGHGTHVAGIVAGNGSRSNGLYQGIAPAARLVGVKVLDAYGSGVLSNVIRGIQWCVRQKERLDIRVINLSLGAPAQDSFRDDPLCQAVQAAWQRGIVVCVAAGNDGPAAGTIATPGIRPEGDHRRGLGRPGQREPLGRHGRPVFQPGAHDRRISQTRPARARRRHHRAGCPPLDPFPGPRLQPP